jgi:hypothetical protein
MRVQRTRRRGGGAWSDGQALIETALVMPLYLALALLFAGAALVGQGLVELRAATAVATVSAFATPAGAGATAMADVRDSFQRSAADPLLRDRSINCSGTYVGAGGSAGVVSCQAQATVSFDGGLIGVVWRWPVVIHQSAQLPVPQYRQCAPAVAQC